MSCLRNTRVILPGYRNERADKKRFKKELGYGHLIQKKKKKPFVKNSYKQHHPTMLPPILSFRLNWKEKIEQCSTQDRLHAGASLAVPWLSQLCKSFPGHPVSFTCPSTGRWDNTVKKSECTFDLLLPTLAPSRVEGSGGGGILPQQFIWCQYWTAQLIRCGRHQLRYKHQLEQVSSLCTYK